MKDERSTDDRRQDGRQGPTPREEQDASRGTSRFAGTAQTAPRGEESAIGTDDEHDRLQEERNRAERAAEDVARPDPLTGESPEG